MESAVEGEGGFVGDLMVNIASCMLVYIEMESYIGII